MPPKKIGMDPKNLPENREKMGALLESYRRREEPSQTAESRMLYKSREILMVSNSLYKAVFEAAMTCKEKKAARLVQQAEDFLGWSPDYMANPVVNHDEQKAQEERKYLRKLSREQVDEFRKKRQAQNKLMKDAATKQDVMNSREETYEATVRSKEAFAKAQDGFPKKKEDKKRAAQEKKQAAEKKRLALEKKTTKQKQTGTQDKDSSEEQEPIRKRRRL